MGKVHLSESDADGPTELARGDTVELALPENPTTGYLWRWRLPEALQLVADDNQQPRASPDLPGCRRLSFAVTAPGKHELRAELARPWESVARQALTFVINAH
jgi:inhibitor of cysteine peptidase